MADNQRFNVTVRCFHDLEQTVGLPLEYKKFETSTTRRAADTTELETCIQLTVSGTFEEYTKAQYDGGYRWSESLINQYNVWIHPESLTFLPESKSICLILRASSDNKEANRTVCSRILNDFKSDRIKLVEIGGSKIIDNVRVAITLFKFVGPLDDCELIEEFSGGQPILFPASAEKSIDLNNVIF